MKLINSVRHTNAAIAPTTIMTRERDGDRRAREVGDAVARRRVDEVREPEHAERLRQQVAAVGQRAEHDERERHKRERRDSSASSQKISG